MDEQIDGVDGAAAEVAVALLGMLGVVEQQPAVKIGLQAIDRFVVVGVQGGDEELVEDGLLKAFDEAVGLGRTHFGAAMGDVVEGQIQLIGMVVRPAEFAAVVGQDCRDDDEITLGVEGQHVVVQDRDRRFRLFGGVQKA